jgi:hypothetical protein
MKPKPLVALNHFTVPLAIVISPVLCHPHDRDGPAQYRQSRN